MSARQKDISAGFRSLAALVLLLFIAAQSACFFHCHLLGLSSDSSGNESVPPCHRLAAASGCHNENPAAPDGSPSWPMSGATCFTLKSMLAGAEGFTISAPDFCAAHLLAARDFSFDARPAGELSIRTKPTQNPDWVFTPAVCLGPAFRSLAPPSFA